VARGGHGMAWPAHWPHAMNRGGHEPRCVSAQVADGKKEIGIHISGSI
jgi:hypothetical protein